MKNVKQSAVSKFELSTLEQLKIDIVTLWSDLAGRRFHLQFPDSTTTVTTLDDISDYEGEGPLQINQVKLKGFSKFTPEEAIDYAKLSLISVSAIDVRKQCHFFECVALLDDESLEKETEYLSTDLQRRIKCLDTAQSAEYTMRELISPLLIGAIMLSDDDNLKLSCEQNIEGELGNGPVDYVISFRSINIVLTEAKKEKIELGVIQNIAQQVANREQFARNLTRSCGMKRKYDDVLSEVVRFPSYGIVTTGDEWFFLRFCESNLIKSEKLTLDIKLGERHDCRRKEDLLVLLRWIVGIIKTQVTNINDLPDSLSVK